MTMIWTVHNQGADTVSHQYSIQDADGALLLVDLVPSHSKAKAGLVLAGAAPDLLAIANKLRPMVKNDIERCRGQFADVDLDELDAAIAKATGTEKVES